MLPILYRASRQTWTIWILSMLVGAGAMTDPRAITRWITTRARLPFNSSNSFTPN